MPAQSLAASAAVAARRPGSSSSTGRPPGVEADDDQEAAVLARERSCRACRARTACRRRPGTSRTLADDRLESLASVGRRRQGHALDDEQDAVGERRPEAPLRGRRARPAPARTASAPRPRGGSRRSGRRRDTSATAARPRRATIGQRIPHDGLGPAGQRARSRPAARDQRPRRIRAAGGRLIAIGRSWHGARPAEIPASVSFAIAGVHQRCGTRWIFSVSYPHPPILLDEAVVLGVGDRGRARHDPDEVAAVAGDDGLRCSRG